jgi:hypothetical protein
MAAMSEEEHAWQESAGGATILESGYLETVDSEPVPATMDVAQEASVHGLSVNVNLVVGDSVGQSELASVRGTGLDEVLPSVARVENVDETLEDNRARKKVIGQQNVDLLAGAAALGGYLTNSLFTWHSASKQQEKCAQEHEKLANRIRTLEEVLSLPSVIDVDTTPITQASDATCVSGTRLFVSPSVSVLQAVPVGLCTLLAGRYIARKIQYYRNALATAEKEARAARDQEIVQTRNALAALAGANEAVARATTEKYEAIARANEAVVKANTARDAAIARANEAVVRANTAIARAAARDQAIAQRSNALAVSLRAVTFGAQEWEKYLGEVGEAPPLPADIDEILDGPCPFWPGKTVRDTHLLVLIPATVGGVPFTLNLLEELIQHPKNGGHKAKCNYDKRVKAAIGKQSPPRSYWLLMTRDVLPNSRNQAYDSQEKLVAAYAGRLGLPYELPHALEAATAILMYNTREGKWLLGDYPLIYTRCQDVGKRIPNPNPSNFGPFSESAFSFGGPQKSFSGCDPKYFLVVGGFSSGGLIVQFNSYGFNSCGNSDSHNCHYYYGVACCRKF